MEDILYEWFAVLLVLVIFSYFSYTKRSLDRIGVLVAGAVGLATYFLGGIGLFFVMVVFFLAAEFCTRCGRHAMGEHTERRTTGNILGNSGAALISLALGSPIAFFGAVAAALADTFSSEIGMMSGRKPRLITSMKSVERGIDGGVTLLGFAAAVLGASLIAIFYFFMRWNPAVLVIITASGFIGSAIDSVLGDVFERKKMLNNTSVNFLASASGALIAWALGMWLLG